jgi:hypothetical protein
MPKLIAANWPVDAYRMVPKEQAEKWTNAPVSPPNREQEKALDLQITSETDYLPFEEEDS